ncbi:MAG: transporter associated domain-containing protein [Alistipes ihumii]
MPESMPAQKLLTLFIRSRHSIAVVIDEFGGTAGMVTIEDILEEIFGEIRTSTILGTRSKEDERQQYLFSGRLEIEYVNEVPARLPRSENYDTLAGYVIDKYQGIPSAGETILSDNKRIKILRTNASRIELMRVTIV